MIIRNNKTTSALYKGTKEIIKRYKGTLVVYEAFKKLIASGVPPITLQKCKGVDLVDYKIYGNSVQNGTPTPDNPVEIQSVGDLVTDENDANYGKYKIPVKVNDNITNIYLDEPLRKVGDYADYIDFENKKVVRNIYEIRLLSSKTYLLGGYTDVFYTNLGSRTINSYRAGMITHGIVSPTKYTSELTKNEAMISPSSKNIYYKNNNFTLETYKEYLNTHIINCCYVFATPTEETIDLPTIPTNKGTNIIEVDTNILPSNMEVKYMGKE